MKHIRWNDELTVGIDTIDQDHKRLIEITNRLIDAIVTHNDRKIVITIFDELEAYTQYHFRREEAFMHSNCTSNDDIDVDLHKEQHRYFIDKLKKYKRNLLSEENIYASTEIFDMLEFLVEWLLDHIIYEDLSLGSCEKSDEDEKSFFDRLNRRVSLLTRARILIFIPLFFLFFSVSYISFDLYDRYRYLDRTEKISRSVLLLYNVIDTLQIERGLSSTYLISKKRTFEELLQDRYEKTDRIIDESLRNIGLIEKFAATRQALKYYARLEKIRRQVLTHGIDRDMSNTYYTRFIRSLIDMIKTINYSVSDDGNFNTYLSILMLIEMSEVSGLIRNEGMYRIVNETNENNILNELYHKKNTLLTLYEHIAEPELVDRLEKEANKTLNEKFDRYLDTIRKPSRSKLPHATEWFDVSSGYIDMFKHTIENLLRAIHDNARSNKKSAVTLFGTLWLTMLLLFLSIVWLSRTLKAQILFHIRAITDALERMAKGDKSPFHTIRINDPVIRKMIDAFDTLRRSLIKADYIDTLVEIEALKSKNFAKLADTDVLTELPNKRAFDTAFRHFFDQALDNKRPMSICVIDLDHFKRINDTYGHNVGDVVLRRFAHSVRKLIDKNDFLARYGGEEFVLLSPSKGLKEACRTAERIRSATKKIDFSDIDENFELSVSIGVASSEEGDFADRLALFKLADLRLYDAKKSGRNRVIPQIRSDSTSLQETP
jgi:diguanylate cyclase (GGDEF)-like protein/hemerythrin-like metal-binding protein